ncbi:hypothetical protein RP20_CCG014974 [Aedes albopictus]|nr:high choriolytic enzyme 1-like [Aedes albopictus]KXJ73696.1 hypothetical protein RP20_CCG014974 [Aedes albopictus]
MHNIWLRILSSVVVFGFLSSSVANGQRRPVADVKVDPTIARDRQNAKCVAEWYAKGAVGNPFGCQVGLKYFDQMEPDTKQAANSLPTSTFQIRLWPKGVVPYVYGAEFTELEEFLIDHAIWQFNTQTCIRFVPRTNQPYYVTFTSDESGCWSYTGRYQNNQWNRVNLQPPCFSQGPGMVVHELMHAIGFHHEFIRPDRSQYIWVNQSATFSWPAVAKNFEVKKSEESEVYGTNFDYGSVMMYSRFAAAGGSDYPVMVNLKPWDPEEDFGNRTGFSYSDLIRVNYMYCNGTKWDIATRKPFSLPIPLDDGKDQAPERPRPPKDYPPQYATIGDLQYDD